MTQKLKIVLVCLLITQWSFSQQKTRADRFFEKGDYINAAKYYEEDLINKRKKKDLENIIISYYNTFQYRDASRYLRLLTTGKFVEQDKLYDNEFNFKFYQVLMALGDYEIALDHLKLYRENLSLNLDKADAIETIEDLKLMNPDYKVNLVDFNSDASDFGAVKYRDSIYFVSDRGENQALPKIYKWTHRPFLNLYGVKDNQNTGITSVPQRLSKQINSKLHDGNFCFSEDGTTIYISKSNTIEGKTKFDDSSNNNIHLYTATFSNNKWSDFEKLSFCDNAYSYQHPALSPDGKKLYFSSNKDGGYGGFDLYYVDINSDGTYGEPTNLGKSINTANREQFPFISSDGHLFFASDGHLGLGLLDNFVSEFVAGNFTKPINLGVPINTQYDDFNLNYYNDKEGFFASNRNKKDDNIFKFVQTGEIFIREYINQFEIRDKETEEFIPNSTVILIDRKGNEIYNNTLDSIASFSANLIAGNYQLYASSENYIRNSMRLYVIEKQDQKHILYLTKVAAPVEKDSNEVSKDLKENDPKRLEMLTDKEGPPIVEREGKLFFDVETIYFDFDMWNIREDSRVILDELAQKLERYPNIILKISSHTDSRGTVRYNQILSERRAEATRNYLALEGYVNARRLKFQGFGELVPKVDCPTDSCTEEEHQLNRRSEFEVISY